MHSRRNETVPKLKRKWTRKDRHTRRCVDRPGDCGKEVTCELEGFGGMEKKWGHFRSWEQPEQKHRGGHILISSSIWREQNFHQGESWERPEKRFSWGSEYGTQNAREFWERRWHGKLLKQSRGGMIEAQTGLKWKGKGKGMKGINVRGQIDGI